MTYIVLAEIEFCPTSLSLLSCFDMIIGGVFTAAIKIHRRKCERGYLTQRTWKCWKVGQLTCKNMSDTFSARSLALHNK